MLRPSLPTTLGVLLSLPYAAGHASYCACSDELEVGSLLMNGQAQQGGRTLSFVRQSTGSAVECGGTYVPGEAYIATLSSTSGQYILEVTGATFDSGSECSGTRFRSTYGSNSVSDALVLSLIHI